MSARRQVFLGLLAVCLFAGAPARADDTGATPDSFSFSGYADFRAVAAPAQTAWLKGGLSKFRYGGADNSGFAEAVGQGVLRLDDTLSAVAVLRAEPEQRTGLDMLEGYLAWHPGPRGALQWSAKLGAFFPTISLENDDLGWASPYTLTPSAINSWIGEELRTIGSEAIVKYDTGSLGTLAVTGAVLCCNDPAGVLMADRGWAMDDRPSGLFGDLREPDATLKLFHRPSGGRTPLFDEIDGRPGWYGGLSWQMPAIGKVSVLRYDNEGDPLHKSGEYSAWDTRFWSYGARTDFGRLVLIAQGLQGQTVIGTKSYTDFQSAFLLASYDWDDWRMSLRGDVFQTRHPAATPSPMSEDGDALTASLSWQGYDWLRLTGEVIAMHSRKGEYLLGGASSDTLDQAQFQLSARLFV